MAQMNRRFARPRFRRRKLNFKWHRVELSHGGIAPNTTSAFNILEPIDYNDTTLSPTGVTMKRLIIEARVRYTTPTALAPGLGLWQWGVAAVDEDHAPFGIDATTLPKERWLAFRVGSLTVYSPANGTVGSEVDLRVDTRVNVRLADDVIKSIFENNASSDNTLSLSGIASVLLVGDTS